MSRENGFFKFAERCLYEYPENCARLERLRADVKRASSAPVQNYSPSNKHGTHSDPVWRFVMRVEAMEDQIETLSRRTGPITRMLADLEGANVLEGSPKAEMARVLRLLYFGKNDKKRVAEELNMSRPQLYRKREELVKLAIRYLGF